MPHCPPWPLTPECLPQDGSWDPDNLTPEQQTALEAASDYLSSATGDTWGACPSSVTVCLPQCGQPLCSDEWCRCPIACRIDLSWPAYGPITVDGDTAANWWIDDYTTLYLHDGCPSGCITTIGYQHGHPVEPRSAASLAVTALAVSYWDNLCRTGQCTLPHETTQVTRDGITMDLSGPVDHWHTGIGVVDDFLDRYRPGPPARMWTLDAQDTYRITDSSGGVS